MKKVSETCELCGLYQYSNKPKIMGRGYDPPQLILIGEAPGPEEAKEGKVFIGRAGKKLTNMLSKYADIHIYVTNAVKCFPPISTTNPSKGFRVPKYNEIQLCSKHLWEEIESFPTDPILMPMGNTALCAVLDKVDGISKYVGFEFSTTRNNKTYRIIPNFHPSYILRNNKVEAEFMKAIDKVRKYLNANTGTAGSS